MPSNVLQFHGSTTIILPNDFMKCNGPSLHFSPHISFKAGLQGIVFTPNIAYTVQMSHCYTATYVRIAMLGSHIVLDS